MFNILWKDQIYLDTSFSSRGFLDFTKEDRKAYPFLNSSLLMEGYNLEFTNVRIEDLLNCWLSKPLTYFS